MHSPATDNDDADDADDDEEDDGRLAQETQSIINNNDDSVDDGSTTTTTTRYRLNTSGDVSINDERSTVTTSRSRSPVQERRHPAKRKRTGGGGGGGDELSHIHEYSNRLLEKRNRTLERRSKVDDLLAQLIGQKDVLEENRRQQRRDAAENDEDVEPETPSDQVLHKNLVSAISKLSKLREQQFTQRDLTASELKDDSRLRVVPVDPPDEVVATALLGESKPCPYCFLCWMVNTANVTDASIDSLTNLWNEHRDSVHPIVLTLQLRAFFDYSIREPANKLANEHPIPEWTVRSIYDHFTGKHGNMHPVMFRSTRLRQTNEIVERIRHSGLFVIDANDLTANTGQAIAAAMNSHVDLNYLIAFTKTVQLELTLMKLNPQTLYTTDKTPMSSDLVDTCVKPSSTRSRRISTLARLTSGTSSSSSDII